MFIFLNLMLSLLLRYPSRSVPHLILPASGVGSYKALNSLKILQLVILVSYIHSASYSINHPIILIILCATFESTLAFPQITSPYFALVIATFNLLGSVRNPMPTFSLLRTQDRIIKSYFIHSGINLLFLFPENCQLMLLQLIYKGFA